MRTIMKLLIFAIFLNSCCTMKTAWKGYKEPTEHDFLSVNAGDNSCVKIGRQNLSDSQWYAIKEAAADVCEIFSGPEFKKAILKRSWLASCELVNGKKDEISGEEVFKLISKKIPDYSINPVKPCRAVGQTWKVMNRVAITPERINGWYSDVDSLKSLLVNTIAHESTHIISYQFMDEGHNKNGCSNDDLVSYSVGNIVQQIRLSKHKHQ